MTGLNLSDQAGPPDSGIGGRFLVDWKTIAAAIITAILAWATIDRRVSVVEKDNVALRLLLGEQTDQLRQQLREQNADTQQQLRELRTDVKELLRRR